MRHHRPLRYISLFSGIEAASVAAEPLGWEPVCFCEIDPFPSAVLAHHYPNVPNLGDITKVDWRPYKGKVDLVVGGSPCFTAGTLVLCEDGFKPIEQVKVGDRVVTHKGRLRKVLNTGARDADVGVLKICGIMPIECTPSHPILTSKRTQRGKANEDGSWFKFKSEKFVSAKDAVGLCACMVSGIDCLVPEYPKVYDLDNVEIAELIGWYLGDGSIASKGRSNPTLRVLELSISPSKLVDFVVRFKQKMNYRVERIDDTRCRVLIYNTELCRFLERHFGRGAANKNIPAWALALSDVERQAIVRGYMATDGHKYESGVTSAESVSKALIIGIQLLSRVGSVSKLMERGTSVIKGVEYRVKPSYKVTLGKSGGRCQIDNGYVKRIVQSFTPSGTATVYNLEVEDDNSYTANGIAVHNCQSFSIAGKREGLEGASGLMFEYIRAVSEIMPRFWVWENVPGALSSSGGADFGCFLREMAGIRGAGGERYGIGWRVLDAQFFGVAQRRRRLFAVGVLGDLAGPAEILFESEGLRWDTPSSREKRQALAAHARSSPAGADGRRGAVGFAQNQRDEVRLLGGDGEVAGTVPAQTWGTHKNETLLAECLTPWDVQSKRVYGEECVAPTLPSGTTEGVNIQPVVMASAHSHAEIGEGVAPSLMAHAEKQPPILATETTCSPHSAQQTAASSSSITNQLEVGGLYSTPDGSAFDPTPVVIDRAAFNQGANAQYPPPHRTDERDGHHRGEGAARGRVLASNGEEYVRALCARDFKGVGSQYVSEGKVIVQRNE